MSNDLLDLHNCYKNYLRFGVFSPIVFSYGFIGQKFDMGSHWVKIKASIKLPFCLEALREHLFWGHHSLCFMASFFHLQSQQCCISLTIFPQTQLFLTRVRECFLLLRIHVVILDPDKNLLFNQRAYFKSFHKYIIIKSI